MATDTEKLVREAIAGVITAAFAAADPAIDAKVYPWHALGHDLTAWPGLFRLDDESFHGWIIKLAQQPAERKNAQRDKVTETYDVWGFYKFRSGKTGDNSDDEFSRIRAVAYEALKAEPRLGFDSTVEWHELLQFDRITTLECGEETLHFAQGRLVVHLCC